MGAAYDRTGAFLGDVQGDTLAKMREEILLKFPAAARVEAHEVPSPFDELLMWLSEQRNDCDHTTARCKTLAAPTRRPPSWSPSRSPSRWLSSRPSGTC